MQINVVCYYISWIVTFDFVVCELGQWVTGRFETLSLELSLCNWYAFPIEMQRVYLNFLLDSQQPVEIQSYPGIVCSRDTFKKVVFFRNYFNNIRFIVFIPIFIFRYRTMDFRILWSYVKRDRCTLLCRYTFVCCFMRNSLKLNLFRLNSDFSIDQS